MMRDKDKKLTKSNVYVGMVGDIIHEGHINLLSKAAEYGLVTVGVLTDKAVYSYKRFPFMREIERKKIIESLKYVNRTVFQNSLDYTENILRLKPDFVLHGDDWQEGIQRKTRQRVIEALDTYGGELIEVPYTKGISSTELLDKISKGTVSNEYRVGLLREYLKIKSPLVFMEAHNGISALVVENSIAQDSTGVVRFDGLWLSSLTDSTARGLPDTELVDWSSRFASLHEISQASTKPIIFDGDTGGTAEHFPYLVRNLEQRGVSAVIIEDKVGDKRNSLFDSDVHHVQDDPLTFCKKIKAGVDSRSNLDFMIIARIESLILNKGLEDALMRATKYVESGADGIMIHSKSESPQEILDFCRNFKTQYPDIPLVCVPSTYHEITFNELGKFGFDIVIYANQLIRSAIPSMRKVADSILLNRRTTEVESSLMTIKDIIHLIPAHNQ